MLAILMKELSSNIGFKGIFKKVLIFMVVAVGHTIDVYVLGSGSAIRTAVIFFYLSNEGISIIENASKIGLPIPEKLKTIFDELKKEK
jgi:toxin secretion/phage lysis holin